MRRLLRLFIALAAGVAWLPTVVSAQTPKVHWTSYAYQIIVEKNGDLLFTETQQLAVDSGSVRKGSLHFDTGNHGRVRQIQVAEDNQPYNRDSSQHAGTFTGGDNGTQLQVDYYFRNPTATRHTMTISYIVGGAIQANQSQPVLHLQLFCQGSGCPTTDKATAQLNFASSISSANLHAQTSGFPVEQGSSGQGLRLVATGAVTGQSLTVNLAFPSSAIPDANVNNSNVQPSNGITTQPATPHNVTFSPVLCVLVIFFLFVVTSIMRSFGRTRRGIPYGGPMIGGPMMGGYPRRHRWWGGGFFPWGGYGGWGRGYGPPPPFVDPPYDPGQPSQPDLSGGGQSWSDSSGGGQSWSDSSGGGQSWNDSGGGGSSWADSSGGGSSWADTGGGGSSGGDGGSFGGDNGSSFS